MAEGARPVWFAGSAQLLPRRRGICMPMCKLAAAFPSGWLFQWGMSGLCAVYRRRACWRDTEGAAAGVRGALAPNAGRALERRCGSDPASRSGQLREAQALLESARPGARAYVVCCVWHGLRAFPATDQTKHIHTLLYRPNVSLAVYLFPVCVCFPLSLFCRVILRQVKSSIAWPNFSPTTSSLPKSPTTKCIN